MSPNVQAALLGAGALAGYLLLLYTNPVRSSLLDGFRAMRRYRTIWMTLVFFGCGYAVFRLLVDLIFNTFLYSGPGMGLVWWEGWHPARAEVVLRRAALPVVESLAGLFHSSVPTFPLSSVFALLFVLNWHGWAGDLWRVLRRRMAGWHVLVIPAVAVFAVAAVLKPFLYLLLPFVSRWSDSPDWLTAAVVTDWLSFLFETILGTGIQVYLVLLVLVWIRGMHVDKEHLLEFAIRRMGYVLKWVVVVLAAGSALIHLPLLLPHLPGHVVSVGQAVDFVERWARWIVAALLIGFCSMQVTLTFHNDSLRHAFRDHFRFLGRNGWLVGWFLLVAGVQFFVVEVADKYVIEAIGDATMPGTFWRLAFPVLRFSVAGWLLASWVCLYKRCETGATHLESFVRY